MNPRTCHHCGGPNPRHVNAEYCSRECKQRAYSARKLAQRQTDRADRTCAHCSAPIAPEVTGRAKFCSRACKNAAKNAARAEAKRAAMLAKRKPCPECGGKIPEDKNGHWKFCSTACKRKAHSRLWRERAPHYMRSYLYGITPEQWQAQLETQGHRCAICRRDDWPGKDNRPHADHDHGEAVFGLRGILCGNCNNGLGMFCDDPALLRAAADYLEAATAA